MKDFFPQIGPDTYVRAGHFFQRDGAALLAALKAVDHSVEFLVVDDHENELLRRHAEIEADAAIAAYREVSQRLPFTDMVQALFEGEDAKDIQIQTELSRLREIIDTPGMGVFAIAGAQADVEAFMDAYRTEPGPAE